MGFASVLIFLAQIVFANGAVWNYGSIPGTPGPIKSKDLVLLKEHVLFDDNPGIGKKTRVFAEFWVYNPTEKDIHVTMGFPLKYDEATLQSQSRGSFVDDFSKKFIVEINDVKATSKPLVDGAGQYTIVYTWEMTFPGMKTTKYTVEYPLTISLRAMDHGGDEESSRSGSEESRSFTYITHTGAYWAKPITNATFEYCSDHLVRLMLRAPSGEISTEEKTRRENILEVSTVADGWSVKPRPYEINTDEGCVVWTRQNWTPRNPEDDIIVSTHHSSYTEVLTDEQKNNKISNQIMQKFIPIFITILLAILPGITGTILRLRKFRKISAWLLSCTIIPIFILIRVYSSMNQGGDASMWPIVLAFGSLYGAMTGGLGVVLASYYLNRIRAQADKR